jgi:hypothetical protein
MKRFLLISALAMFWSIGLNSPIQAQQPNVRYYYIPPSYSYGPSYYAPQTNEWANQYFNTSQSSGLPYVAVSNQWSRQALRVGNSDYNNGSSMPTLYRPYYNINGVRSVIVPNSSPNYYAAPTYRYIQIP